MGWIFSSGAPPPSSYHDTLALKALLREKKAFNEKQTHAVERTPFSSFPRGCNIITIDSPF